MKPIPAAWQEALGWTLIHSLWQCAVAAALLVLVLRAAGAKASTLRYTAACIALGVALAAPVGTFAWLVSGGRAPAESTTGAAEIIPSTWGGVRMEVSTAPAGTAMQVSAAQWRLSVEPVLPWIVRAWALGALVLSIRLLGGWLWVRRLARSGLVPAPPEWVDALERIRARLGIGRRVALWISPRVAGPSLVGWLRPVVLMPLSATSGLTMEQVELLLLHELVHVRRWDYLFNLVQRLAETILFYHPGVWWISARIREEREHCCDDAVVARAGVRRYVGALLALEVAREPSLALGAGGGSLAGRVRRLAGQGSATRGSASAVLGTAAVALAGLALAAGVPARTPRPAPVAGCTGSESTTLCPRLGRSVDALLRDAGVPGAAIVQDVATGAVLAYASTGDSVDVRHPLLPASVWKLAVAAVWWERGLARTPVDCPASLRVGGTTVRNAGGAGGVTSPEDVLVRSCNTAAVEMLLRLGRDGGAARLAGELRGLGFPVAHAGEQPSLDRRFWAASSGAFRARMAPLGATIRVDDGAPDALAALALATSSVRVTPLHLSRFLQAVGNGGVMRAPTLEPALAGAGGGVRVMSSTTAARLQHAMLRTVAEGTARAAAGTQPGAWKLGGKTGTVGGGAGREPDGWFAGLVVDPAGRPRYTVLVHLRGGGPGGDRPTRIAARLARELAES